MAHPCKLFSAYAEVFPAEALKEMRLLPFLCLRRGVSMPAWNKCAREDFSLPTQRCFRVAHRLAACLILFSAYAEVFLKLCRARLCAETFLCLRRGVSKCRVHRPSCYILFSAYAEVFLGVRRRRSEGEPFLCLRRGVSVSGKEPVYILAFSLPTQRCFYTRRVKLNYAFLFSAYAEVFLL